MDGNGNGNGNGDGGPMDVDVSLTVGDVALTSFSINLLPGVPELTGENLQLMPNVTIQEMTPGQATKRYTVKTVEELAYNTRYTLSITKPGYNIADASFQRNTAARTEAKVTQATLTVASIEIEGNITAGENSIVFPGGARGSGIVPTTTLTGIISLVLSPGARILNTSFQNTERTYTNTPTALVVEAEDGMVRQVYSIAIAAYDAQQNPYLVYTPAHLNNMRHGLQDTYRLVRDIALPNAGEDCSDEPFVGQADYCAEGWLPIGDAQNPFQGTFDGQGHVIQNLFISRNNHNNIGLFGAMQSGTIRNLGVVLAPAGVSGQHNVSGLMGNGQGGKITQCYVKGAVSGSTVVGVLAGDANGIHIERSYATGSATGTHTIGGLVGRLETDNFANCYATSSVTGTQRLGGLVGHMPSGGLTSSYATGTITGSTLAGGLVGQRDSSAVVRNSYYPTGRYTGTAPSGQPMPPGSGKTAFVGFAFGGTQAAWGWIDDKWPQLQGFKTQQMTPDL